VTVVCTIGEPVTKIDDDLGRPVHCRELSSGNDHTGMLLITEREITVDLFAYEKRYIDVNETAPIHLQTQNLNVVSLHSNVSVFSGTAYRQSDDLRLRGLRHNRINSFTAVIGPSPWLKTDIVKSAFFQIDDADFMLRHTAKREQIATNELGEDVDFNLFSVATGELTVRGNYGATYSASQPFPIRLFTTLCVDFHVEQSLSTYLRYVGAVVQLFAASSGLPLRPSSILVSRHSFEDQLSPPPEREFREPHHVKYIWPEVKFDKTLTWAGSSFLLATDDKELQGLKDCVAAWTRRIPEWEKSRVPIAWRRDQSEQTPMCMSLV
jgi:hypothetical protein